MNIKIGESAVSEILGTVLLIAIAVSAFSVIYMQVLSDQGPSEQTYATLVGKMENGDYVPKTVAFENQRGETIGPDAELLLYINGKF